MRITLLRGSELMVQLMVLDLHGRQRELNARK